MSERVADAAARERALDVSRSFLVQAPAGSGKTELLIQRFLALLARVERPEQIVAMTFTRKAAGEMRERIVRALRATTAETPIESAHQRRTRELAREALRQDDRHGWQLMAHPARLAVQTIDAFCAGLAQQAPLATRLGAAPHFVDDARPLYEVAVRSALARATPADDAWATLLRHLDNDARLAVALLSVLLGKREPFLRKLAPGDGAALRSSLEAALAREIEGELEQVARVFPRRLAAELPALQRYAAEHADGAARVAPLSAALLACADAGGLPPVSVEAQDAWRALASWLLVTNEPQFRRRVDRNDGFPAKGNGAGAAERAAWVDRMNACLAELAAEPGLAEALELARCLPPRRYTEAAWSVVSALQRVLPRLAGELMLAFRDAGALDFTQGTIAALDALGDEEAPSDLLLRLDLRVSHLLIDEFQDTSYTQLELLRRLTAGWAEGDGRTVFAVGDPMQSIYRFREAEVRIFVEAQSKQQVAGIRVETLTLARNFRSHDGLVAWVNATFPRVLGSRSDPWRGAVAFVAAASERPAPPGVTATVDILADPRAEAERVIGQVRAALADGEGTIAILVRARAHLDCVLPALRAAGIAYAAVELDALAERQAIVDLASLTHALMQPADRLAWLAVLRAPWCGLTLGDLFVVAAAADAHPAASIAALMTAPDTVAALSEDGARRLASIARVLQPALAARGRAPLTARVRGAWLALGGPALLDDPIDIEAAERYFELLAGREIGGDLPDWPGFVAALDELYVEPAPDAAVRVHVMTLHRAKGLEFDTVIMPGLARRTGNQDPDILRLRVREHGLLLAPARARGGAHDPLYDYLGLLAADEDRAELGRLLYVGCTRARERLHLTASLGAVADVGGSIRWRPPPGGSALARLWEALAGAMPPPLPAEPERGGTAVAGRPLVRALGGWTPPVPPPGVTFVATPAAAGESLPFDWVREVARHVGVVAHRHLALLAREGLAAWDEARIAAAMPRIRTELAGEGVDVRELDRATADVVAVLANVLADPRARWLFAAEHADACSEWALAGQDAGAIAHVVLDRTFVADGVRWIVDFKTGRHEGADLEAFLDREQERYREQLERYGRFVRALDPRPIRLGLYHPLLRGWREWAA